MAEISQNVPTRLPDHASVEAVLARLPDGADETALAAALADAFPGFTFSTADLDDEYWRDTRSVIAADGTRIAEYRPWMEAELAKDNGDVRTVWERLRNSNLQLSEWHGNSAYAFAPTGPGAADYVQISLGREVEWRARPIVDPLHSPWSRDELFDFSFVTPDELSDDKVLAGPCYRLLKDAGSSVVHVRSFLARCRRLEREKREARRPEMERRFLISSDGARTPFLQNQPDWFDFVPREVRFFQDWEESSARSARVYEHYALDISDYEHRGERNAGFITRPLRMPAKKLEKAKPPFIS